MLKNNNQVAIKRIYQRMLKQNKLRNYVTILAIVLTTFMFTSVFTMGFSMVKNLNQMQLRNQGTKASIYLSQPTIEQLEEVKLCKSLHVAGVQIYAGDVTDQAGEYSYSLKYYDKEEFSGNLTPAISDITGSYPEREDEIMMSQTILETLGITKPTLNQTITVYTEKRAQAFCLSGWYTAYANSRECFVSKSYIEREGLTMDLAGRLSISAKEGRQGELLDELYDNLNP